MELEQCVAQTFVSQKSFMGIELCMHKFDSTTGREEEEYNSGAAKQDNVKQKGLENNISEPPTVYDHHFDISHI